MRKDKEIYVLLIEDDEEDFILTRDYLKEIKQRQYKLDWINSYEEGLKKIREGKYDAYLVDYRLGGGTGVELISEAVDEGSNAPFILLTGLGTPEIDEMAMKVGAADYLVKSNIDSETLDRSIRYSIRQYNLLQEVKMLHAESEQLVTERTWELAEAIKELEKTNRNLIEEMVARRIAKEEKEKSQKLYFTIGENYPNGFIAVFNKNLEYVFIEGQLLTDLNISKEELLGKSFSDHFSSESLNYINQNFQKAFNGERTVFEMFFNNRYLQSYALPLAEHDGQVKQVMLVTQDVTERKKAIEEISNALEKEKTLNELKSRFVSMASHEFRTPLGTILSSVTLISKYNAPGDEEKRNKHISRIKSAVVNLTGILNDFLSLSRLEEGKVSYNPKTIDIHEMCEEVKEEMQVTAKPGQDIIIENDGIGQIIVMDRQILKNILINLTSNAIKYSPEDENVYISTLLDDEKFTITVRDKGIGIPLEDQKHLFDTFFRAGNVTHIQGTGLGLNIVKKYVDLLGGSIRFSSRPGKGTEFVIEMEIDKLKMLVDEEKERIKKEELNIERYE
jgi:PAS domain S-box-containing protein